MPRQHGALRAAGLEAAGRHETSLDRNLVELLQEVRVVMADRFTLAGLGFVAVSMVGALLLVTDGLDDPDVWRHQHVRT